MTYVAEICGTWFRVVARQSNGSAGRVVLDFLGTAEAETGPFLGIDGIV